MLNQAAQAGARRGWLLASPKKATKKIFQEVSGVLTGCHPLIITFDAGRRHRGVPQKSVVVAGGKRPGNQAAFLCSPWLLVAQRWREPCWALSRCSGWGAGLWRLLPSPSASSRWQRALDGVSSVLSCLIFCLRCPSMNEKKLLWMSRNC